MGVLNTIVSSSEARSPFFAPPFFSPSTKERSLSISPPGEQTRLELDKNICEKISFFFSSFLPIEKEKEENDFANFTDRESLSAYLPLRKVGKETNIHVRCSWDSFLFCPLASPRVLKKERDRN